MAEFILGRIRFVWKGNWTPGANYLVDDVISSGGKSYICVINHTSSTLLEDDLLSIPSKWNIVSDGIRWRGDWEPNEYYNPGGMVKYGGLIYICNTSHTSASFQSPSFLGLENDIDKWDTFATSFNWIGDWTPSSRYRTNDIVTYGGITYVCIDPHISKNAELGLEDDSDKWEIFNKGIKFLGPWNATGDVRYKENEVVKYGANLWICIVPHTSTTNWLDDESNWEIFVKGFEFENSWSSNTEYQIGDTVTYGGYSYIAKVNHINKVPTQELDFWDPFTTGFHFKGSYSSSIEYKVGDVVRYGAYTYVAKADSQGESIENGLFWGQLNAGIRWTNSPQTYENIGAISVTGNGTGASFSITRSNTVYSPVILLNSGTNYAEGDELIISGNLLGGITPANDITITVTNETSGEISGFVWEGSSVTWRLTVRYLVGDVVFFGPTSFICVKEHTSLLTNRPDNDNVGEFWNTLAAGAESAILTTNGDMLFYGENGPTRLPIGTDGQVLQVNSGFPSWTYYGVVNNLVYVSPEGVDEIGNGRGLILDKPWRTIRFACDTIETGYLRTEAKELLQKNKQFLIKEVSNWVTYNYSVAITATTASANTFTCDDTDKLLLNMPIEFKGNVFGGVDAGTTYYVRQILSDTTFTISTVPAGSVVTLTSESGSMIGTLSYDYELCERDTGLIVDALAYDLSHDGNEEVTRAARAYYTETGLQYINANFGQQIIQTIGAYNHLKQLAISVLNNLAPDVNYQRLNDVENFVEQYIDTDLVITSDVETLSNLLLDIILDALNSGSAASIRPEIKGQTTISVKTGTYQEILPIVVPKNVAIVGEELRSTVVQPNFPIPLLENDKEKSISALNRIKEVSYDLVRNVKVDALEGNTEQQQYINNASGNTEATVSVDKNSQTISNILEKGLSEVPDFNLPVPTNRNAGFIDGRTLLIDNKEFLKAEITSWIAVQVAEENAPFTSGFTYNVEACARDVGYIVDAISYDITYGGNLETLVAARAYISGGLPTFGSGEKDETLAAYAYLKSIIDDIITANPITKSAGNLLDQDVGVPGQSVGSSDAATFAQDRVQDIFDAIDVDGDDQDPGYPVTVEPDLSWVDANKRRFNTALLAARTDIRNNSIVWVQDNYPDLVFDTALCSRDVGLIIDALRYDFMFGSNFRSTKAGMSYRRGLASTLLVLNSQLSPTLGLIEYVRLAVRDITAGTFSIRENTEVMVDIMNGGLTAVPAFQFTDPTNYQQGFFGARRLIELNTDFLKTEITAWISFQIAGNIPPFSSGFTYDANACARDVEYILDAIRYDLTYGGNLETLVAARAYFVGTSSTYGSGEKEQTIAAYAYLKSIISSVARGLPIDRSQGNTLIQNTTTPVGLLPAGTFAQARIQDIIDTLENDGVLPEVIEPNLEWVDSELVIAFNEFQSRKSRIQNESIKYIKAKYPELEFNENTCARDVGFIVDAFGYDLMFGSNFRSIKAAMSYYRGITSAEEVIDNQLEPTVDIIGYISDDLIKISAGTSGNTGSVTAIKRTEYLADVMYDVLTNGLGSEPLLLLPDPVGYNVGFKDARQQLLQNTEFMVADARQFYINNYFSVWTAIGADGQAAFTRDIRYILDALRYDITYGGNTQSLITGRSYYSFVTLIIPQSELPAILATYGHLRIVVAAVITKNTSTFTPQVGNTVPRVTAGPEGSSAASTFTQDRVQDIIDWIDDGFSPAEISPNTSWVDDDLVAAFEELQSRKDEIEYDSIGWVRKFFQEVNFNEEICSRDVGYIVDAFGYDIMFGSNFASTIAARSYHRGTLSAQLVLNQQKDASLGLIKFLKYKVKSIVAVGAIAQIESAINDITGFITGGAVPRFSWPNPINIDTDIVTAKTLIWDNKEFVKAEVIQFIENNYPSLDYSREICARDVGYLLDAIRYDLTFGGNSQSVAAAETYYSYGTELQIPTSELAATVAAYGFLKELLEDITVNTAVTPLQTIVKQIIGQSASTIAVQGIVGSLVDDIIEVVGDTSSPVIVDPDTSWVPASRLSAQSLLTVQKPTIVSTITNFIQTNYPTLVYNVQTCERDIGLIIDAVGWDYVLNSNYRTVIAGMSYYRAAASLVVGEQKLATVQAYRFLKTQLSTSLTLDTEAKSFVRKAMDIVIEIVDKGIGETPEINGTNAYRNSDLIFNATNILELNKNFLAKEASEWVKFNFGGTVIGSDSVTNVFTTSKNHNLSAGDPIRFSGALFSGVEVNTTYYVFETPSKNTFSILTSKASITPLQLVNSQGEMTVTYFFNEESCLRDTRAYVDALIYDLSFPGNYKSLNAAQIYVNAVDGSLTSNMYLTRNGCGIRNQTVTGLSGVLTEPNDFGTRRPTAGAYVSLDPGFGPADFKSWVTTKSCYVQNVTTFGTGCVGNKIDGAIHLGGNKSMVSNDFTQVLSDGIGVWCTGAGSLTELVSVFSYYGYAGYLAEFGGRIRATNGNSSYGEYGVIAEGTDTYEQPVEGTIDNRSFDAPVFNTITDGTNEILALEYGNAGSNYTNATYSISGTGFNATAIGDEFRDGAVFETRIIDPDDGTEVGGTEYLTASNVAQSGTPGIITIANTDQQLSNAYNGMRVQITAGTGVGQFANILSFNNGTKEAVIYKDSFVPLAVTATTSGTNLLTTSSNATLFENMPVVFSGTTFGGATALEIYFVRTISGTTQFTISETSGGSDLVLTTASGSMTMYAAGWDNIVPGKTTTNLLDLTSGYTIEPRLSYSDPGFTSIAKTVTNAQWSDIAYGDGRFVAIASGSTNSIFSANGDSWGNAGALANTSQSSVAFGGGQGAKARVVVGGLGGQGAILEAVLGVPNVTGAPTQEQVAAVRIVNGGQGYNTPPVIEFTPVVGGQGAVATCTVRNGSIVSVTIVIPGSGYSVPPTVTAATDKITEVVVESWGKDYSESSTTITLLGGGFTEQATVDPILTNNGISSYTITNPGAGYTSVPDVIITDTRSRFLSISSGSNVSCFQSPTTLGSAWATGGNLPATNFSSVAYGAASGTGIFVAVGGSGSAASTPDGVVWTGRTIPTLGAGTYVDVAFGNGIFVAIPTGNVTTAFSTNGITWTAGGNLPTSTTWVSVAYGNGRFVAIASGGRNVAYSLNKGATWTASVPGLPVVASWTKITYGQGVFMAIASGTSICATSPDGVSWSVKAMPSSTTWNAIAFGNPASKHTIVALSQNTAGALIRTGAKTAGRVRVADGKIIETRLYEPGSGYPTGFVTSTTSGTNLLTVDSTVNLIANQPIEFFGESAGGVFTNKTYYVVSGSITATQFQISEEPESSTPISLETDSEVSMSYKAGPILTQFDSNRVQSAALKVRLGNGALGNPTFSNRGQENTTATTTVSGDGFADLFQSGTFINIKGLFEIPLPGSNIEFSSLPGEYFKLVAVTNILGIPGNFTAQFQINPSISVLDAPEHNVEIKTSLLYSQVRLTGHDFLYIGTGNFSRTNYPNVNIASAIQESQELSSGGGRVFFTSTDQDGNFNVGNLFGVQQATGTATLDASAFNLSGLQSLQLGSVAIGVGSAVINQFSTDPFFTADSDNVVPTQRAIRAYITSQIGGGASSLNVNTLTSGVVFIAGNSITTTTGVQLNINAKMNFTGGIDGAPVALGFFLQR
jgi:hypothetical protein